MFSGLAGSVAVALIVLGSGMIFVSMLLPTLTEFQIGPSGFSAKLRERDQEVEATLEPESGEPAAHRRRRWPGAPRRAGSRLDKALVETCMRWQQAKQDGPADTVAQAPLAIWRTASDETRTGATA